MSSRIGLRIGLEPEVLRGLHQGAYLHDVGKISIPDQVLNKPGELTAEEWESIKGHPVIGWELAMRARSLCDSLPAIRHHHERWDGSGYPDRLAGVDIPLVGRIVAVADVWDALTSDRAYRPAWPFDRAISHIAGGGGTLFDPLCVEAFLNILEDSGLVPEKTQADVEALLRAGGACHSVSDRRVRTTAPSLRPFVRILLHASQRRVFLHARVLAQVGEGATSTPPCPRRRSKTKASA